MAGFLKQCLINMWWAVALVAVHALTMAVSDPQINFLIKACSDYNATSASDFISNQNATFADLRNQLSGQNKSFATAEQDRTSDPVFALAMCRDYMSTADCVACFDAAVKEIRKCSVANGARVFYDGCYLRYESVIFFDQGNQVGSGRICGNKTASQPTAFHSAVQGLLVNLEVATPRITGYFAAAKKEVIVGTNETVYGVAQCAKTVTMGDCRTCLNMAIQNIMSCFSKTEGRAYDAGCFLRYSNKAFFAANNTIDLRPFLRKVMSRKTKAIIVSATVGGSICILLTLSIVFLWYRRSRKARADRRANLLGATELRGPMLYSYRDLQSATKNFSEENKLGEGGFGGVYKGTLKNGNVVAVKRLALASDRVKSDFEIEVKLISNIHHRNLLRLQGCCQEGPELLLVYDCMANGSLDKFLYGERRGSLNWKQRFDIIFGTARGLAYLHEQFHVCIIHRDIKSSNILLDDHFQPRIADFGFVRLLPGDQSHLITKFAGTLGYTAPEYAIHGQLSEKVDTYSFGVVVLELISGRRCNDIKVDPVTEYLLEEAWKLYEDGLHLQLVDESLDPNEYQAEDIKKVIEIALMCTQSPASARPTMSKVVVLLASEGAAGMRRPSRPTFIDNDKRIRGHNSTSTGSSTSNATASSIEFVSR
ncbi:Non-specific serine/threonine protein kinase [Bertholletia excelsa]